MSFIRQIKRKGRVYLAEVENKWVEGEQSTMLRI
jgi:hypothetical protein